MYKKKGHVHQWKLCPSDKLMRPVQMSIIAIARKHTSRGRRQGACTLPVLRSIKAVMSHYNVSMMQAGQAPRVLRCTAETHERSFKRQIHVLDLT